MDLLERGLGEIHTTVLSATTNEPKEVKRKVLGDSLIKYARAVLTLKFVSVPLGRFLANHINVNSTDNEPIRTLLKHATGAKRGKTHIHQIHWFRSCF